MRYRKLGHAGIDVSEIGFGTWGIGGPTDDGANSYGPVSDAESVRALHRAVERGITFFDTSNIYGYGHSEKLLGEAFASRPHEVVLASKVGFVRHGGPHDVSPDYVVSCLESTLRRLRRDFVDLYQLHSPPLDLVRNTPGLLETLQALKQAGKIRAIGYSVKSPADGLGALELPVDALQVNFNMIDQRAVTCGLLEQAHARGVGVIARTPFAFGFLTGTVADLAFGPLDHRSTWSPAQLKRWQGAPAKFEPVRTRAGGTAGQLALRYCLSYEAVCSVIPGMMSVSEVDANADAAALEPLQPEHRADIRRIYSREEFFEAAAKA